MLRILTNTPQDHLDDCEVLCFDGKPAKNSSFNPKNLLTFSTIMKNLPENWIPDYVVFKTPQFYPIPINIDECPFVTVLLLDDWFGSADYLPDNMAGFDYIFTDRFSVGLLRKMGFTNVDYWPCFGFDPSVFRVLENESRTIDVSFTGSFNSNIQTKRLPYLSRICKLSDRYTVKLYYNLWKEEYVKVLNRSKIVFNRSIKGEMNMRCFEAPACKALLFIEEENLEVAEYLEPGRECVVYNNSNLEELIEYYLENEEERSRIAEAGYHKIQRFTYAKLFSKLLNSVESKDLVPLKNRKKPQVYASSVLHREFVQVSLSLYGRTENTFPIITELIRQSGVSALTLNDCAVILSVYIEDNEKTLSPEQMEKLYGFCVSFLESALKSQSSYRTAVFNLAQIFFSMKKYREASYLYQRVLQKPLMWNIDDFKGQVLPIHYISPLRYLWSEALIKAIDDGIEAAKNRHNVLSYVSCMKLAETEHALGNYDEGQGWFRKAVGLFPDHPTAPSAYVSHIDSGKLSVGDREILTKAFSENPFITKHWELYLLSLSNSGNEKEAVCFAKECLLTLSRVQFAEDKAVAFFNNYISDVFNKVKV